MFRWRGVLTARDALALSAATLGAILAVPGVGQATQSKRITASDPDYPPPYDSSKADRALQAFDKNHPECAVWSNWRKLCSRIGPGGSNYCRTDPDHHCGALTAEQPPWRASLQLLPSSRWLWLRARHARRRSMELPSISGSMCRSLRSPGTAAVRPASPW